MEKFDSILGKYFIEKKPTGVVYKAIKSIRKYLQGNMVIHSPFWDKHFSKSTPAEVQYFGWNKDEFIQSEGSPMIAAYEAFEVLFSFLKSLETSESVYFTCCLHIKNKNNEIIGTRKGATICLNSKIEEDKMFDEVTDFLYVLKDMIDAKYTRDTFSQYLISLDANVMDDIRFMRKEEENLEIISFAIIITEILKSLSKYSSDGSFVKVSHKLVSFDKVFGRCISYITARWPDELFPNQKAYKDCVDILSEIRTDYKELLEKVQNMSVDDGLRNILLLGRTGSGKSHTGNWLLKNLGIQDSTTFVESQAGSMTSYVQYLPLSSKTYRIWDTPGLNDQFGRDALHIDSIERSFLSMGTISCVILCLDTALRIDSEIKKIMRRLMGIIGPPFQQRLLVFINLQYTPVNENQIASVQNSLEEACSVRIPMQNIFDLGLHAQTLSENKLAAFKAVMDYCKMQSVKAGYLERLVAGLRELQDMHDETEIENRKEDLIWMSSRVLRNRLSQKAREIQLLSDFNDGGSLVLSSQVPQKGRNGRKYFEKHIFSLPAALRRNILSRTKVVTFGIVNRFNPGQKIINLARDLRLVFIEEQVKYEVKKGSQYDLRKFYYVFLSVDEAIDAQTREVLNKALGGSPNESIQTYMHKSNGEKHRNRPVRRHKKL